MRKKYFNSEVLLLIILGVILLFKFSASPTFDSVKTNAPLKNEGWRERIERVGAEKTYQEFKIAYAQKTFGIQHTATHIIGELIYEKAGLTGVTICDETFAFGCYHGFFGRALANNGIDIIPQLDKLCRDKYGNEGTGCQHGIGHGAMQFLGPAKLLEALNACSKTTEVHPLFGCAAGVFMENNASIRIADNNAKIYIREFNTQNPYEPCNTIVPERFKNSCYHEISLWWRYLFGGDFKKIGSFCGNTEEDYQEVCFLGTGNVVTAFYEYDIQKTINGCRDMPPHGEMPCKIGAAGRLAAFPELRPKIMDLCENNITCLERLIREKVIENL